MDPVTIPRTASDAGVRALIGRVEALERAVRERSAQISQISVSSGDAMSEPWTAPTEWGDVTTVTLPVPGWSPTRVAVLTGLYLKPDFDLVVADTEVLARVQARTSLGDSRTAPNLVATLLSLETSTAGSWAMGCPLQPGDTTVTVAAQAKSGGGTIPGGRVTLRAVAVWSR